MTRAGRGKGAVASGDLPKKARLAAEGLTKQQASAVTFAIVIALLSIGLAVGVANVGTTSPVDAGQAG